MRNLMSYNHIYQCSSTLLRDASAVCETDANGNLKTSPCVSNQGTELVSCSFQPRVQVRDNWGWCSGTCNSNEGCFDGDGDLATASSTVPYDECLSSLPSTDHPEFNPWVYYGGVITVTP